MGDINYRVRMLYLRGENIFTPQNETYPEFERRTKEELLLLLRYMNDLQFEIVRDRIAMEKKINKNGEVQTLKYNIQYLLQNGETRPLRPWSGCSTQSIRPYDSHTVRSAHIGVISHHQTR